MRNPKKEDEELGSHKILNILFKAIPAHISHSILLSLSCLSTGSDPSIKPLNFTANEAGKTCMQNIYFCSVAQGET